MHLLLASNDMWRGGGTCSVECPLVDSLILLLLGLAERVMQAGGVSKLRPCSCRTRLNGNISFIQRLTYWSRAGCPSDEDACTPCRAPCDATLGART